MCYNGTETYNVTVSVGANASEGCENGTLVLVNQTFTITKRVTSLVFKNIALKIVQPYF
jgi:hypothetical protein